MWYVDIAIDKWLSLYPGLRESIKDSMTNPRPFIEGKFAGIAYDNRIQIFTYRIKSDGEEMLNRLITLTD